jgi:hypothetical protein
MNGHRSNLQGAATAASAASAPSAATAAIAAIAAIVASVARAPLAALVALTALLCSAPARLWADPPATPAGLAPCVYTAEEMASVFELTLDRAEASDMTLPGGRDVGCIYTFRETSFELAVRQTWGTALPPSASAESNDVKAAESPVELNDAEEARWKAAPADRPGAGGELTYLRGRVRTKVVVRGGRFTGTEVLKRLQVLRRVP